MTKQEIKKALGRSIITQQLKEDLKLIKDMNKGLPQGITEISAYNLGIIRGIQQERKLRATKNAK